MQVNDMHEVENHQNKYTRYFFHFYLLDTLLTYLSNQLIITQSNVVDATTYDIFGPCYDIPLDIEEI